MKKLLYGLAINDYCGIVSHEVNGRRKTKGFYKAWNSMIERCYCEKFHQRCPTYIGSSVCKDWLILSNFKTWHDKNYIEGYQLDKDIIKIGNKVYSPEYCRYVSPQLNSLLTGCDARRGDHPKGVVLYKEKSIGKNTYRSQVNYKGKKKHIGYYSTIKQAFTAYVNAKHKIIIEAAHGHTDIALREGLVNHAKNLLNEAEAYDSRI